ncbi:MAG: hypothetical protein FWG05_00345 [Kiritimatiellaeota bacterium]|nr:hypothetical protein [Kiritimatiellota bacterium]
MKTFAFIPFLTIAALALTSCGRNDTAPAADGSDDNAPAASAKPAAAVKGTPAEAAKATMQAQVDAVAKGDFKALYTGLPASYQKDISTVVKAAAAKLDADIYKGVSELLVAAADIGVANSKLVAEMFSDDEMTVSAAEVKAAATAIQGLVKKITLDSLKKGDIAAILSNKEFAEVGKLMKDKVPLPKITGSKENADGSVTITFTDADGDEDESEYVKVDGVWMPASMTEDWSDKVKEALADIAEFKVDEESKAQYMSILPTLKIGLEGLKKAKTEAEFQQGAMMLMMPIMMMQMGSGGGFDFDDDDDDDDE